MIGLLIISAFARETLKEVNPLDGPDDVLLLWLDQEERLFRRLERQVVDTRLRAGFLDNGDTDVDGFISFSLSIQNRRKSRAGYAFENHLEDIFKAHRINYSREKQTENKSKPDFIFPSIEQYHDTEFNPELLTMLGAKTSCKERWRQVLAEANRNQDKHLITLEPSISEDQTN
jgi:hypothetical protein